MTVERVATNAQSQYLLSQIMKANTALDTTQAQVASGKVSSDYLGIGDKTASLEAARAAAARAAGEQRAPGEDEAIAYEDSSGEWREEEAGGADRPEPKVKD